MRMFENMAPILYYVMAFCNGGISSTISFIFRDDVHILISYIISPIFKFPEFLASVLTFIVVILFNVECVLTFVKWAHYVMIMFFFNALYNLMVKRLGLIPSSNVQTAILTNCRIYNSIAVMLTIYNNFLSGIIIWRKFMIIAITSFGFAMCVNIRNAVTLTFSLGIFSVLLLAILLTDFTLAASIYENAKECRRTLRAYCSFRANGNREYISKRVISLRPLRIQAGDQYFLDAGVVPKILNAVMQNTISIMLTFQWVYPCSKLNSS